MNNIFKLIAVGAVLSFAGETLAANYTVRLTGFHAKRRDRHRPDPAVRLRPGTTLSF